MTATVVIKAWGNGFQLIEEATGAVIASFPNGKIIEAKEIERPEEWAPMTLGAEP